MDTMPWAPHPGAERSNRALDLVTQILDQVLVPLGFAPGQVGTSGGRGQVIFCRGEVECADDGCADLVLDVEATPHWHIADVRYWEFPADRWHLEFDRDGVLLDQLSGLSQTLPGQLA